MQKIIFLLSILLLLVAGFACRNTPDPPDLPDPPDTHINPEEEPEDDFVFFRYADKYGVDADSLALADVQAAVNTVSGAGGGAVYLPEGEVTWEGNLVITGDVSLIGHGFSRTRINLGPAVPYFLTYNIAAGHSTIIRISGIAFLATTRASGGGIAQIFLLNNLDRYRISHCFFRGIFHRAITTTNTPGGLIDHCHFQRIWAEEPTDLNNTGYGLVPDSAALPAGSKPEAPVEVINGYLAGADAKERNAVAASGNTVIARLNDAGGSAAAVFKIGETGTTGRVVRLYFMLTSAEAGASVKIASFNEVSTNTFTTRSTITVADVHAGINMVKPDSLVIYEGDYLGISLTNCSLAVQSASGSAAWNLAGDRIPCSSLSFGSPALGEAALYAELYDTAGSMAAYETSWNNWYSQEPAVTARNGLAFDPAWTAADTDVHCVEDCTFYWFKGTVGPYQGNLSKLMLRNNHILSDTIKYYQTIFNPGTNFAVVYNNTFEQNGPQDDGQDIGISISSSGLIFDNTFINLSRPGMLGYHRSGQGFYYTEETRMRELFIFDNTYQNCGDGAGDNPATWRLGTGGTRSLNWVAEGLSHHFRAPQTGDRLYKANTPTFDCLAYPHYLIAETDP